MDPHRASPAGHLRCRSRRLAMKVCTSLRSTGNKNGRGAGPRVARCSSISTASSGHPLPLQASRMAFAVICGYS